MSVFPGRVASLVLLVVLAGCTEGVRTGTHPDAAFLTTDSGADANDSVLDAGLPPPVRDLCESPGSTVGHACTAAADCQDGCFCNGTEACTAGHCALGTAPCADTIDCTTDACLEETDHCVHVPDHGMCSDHLACDGYEVCDLTHGCQSAPPLVCNDESSCTLDTCDDAVGCVFTPRDLDHDGFVSSACGGLDCDDYSAAVVPGSMEICDNHIDDNCDGLRDYADPSCHPTNDDCAEATFMTLGTTGATYSGSTIGMSDDYTLSCGSGGADVVFRFTLTESHDVRVTASGASGISVALRDYSACVTGPDVRCANASPAVFDQRSLGAGTWAVIVSVDHPTTFDLRIDLTDMTVAPPIDHCDGMTTDVSAGGTFTGLFEDTTNDYTLSCNPSVATDAAYRFTIPVGDARDVLITASTMTGSAMGQPFLSLTSDCTMAASEIVCTTNRQTSLSRHGLGAGTYFILLEPDTTTATSWSITVTFTDPPAARSPGDACTTALDITPVGAATTGTATALATSLEYDTGTTCGTAGASDAYFHFTLTAAHDVTVTSSSNASQATALSTSCGVRSAEVRCNSGASSLTQTFHSLAAGDYWITVQTPATTGMVTASIALSAPTVAPANDTCSGATVLAVPIDSHPHDTLIGFTDDLMGGACAPTGLVDAFYTFTLPSPMSVTIDVTPTASSSIWVTLRNVCGAGTDVACNTGFGSAHMSTATLAAGTYWVIVEMRATEASDFRLQFSAFM